MKGFHTKNKNKKVSSVEESNNMKNKQKKKIIKKGKNIKLTKKMLNLVHINSTKKIESHS